MHTPALTYAQMRPKGVESNHFAYHLDQLVRTGLIAKRDPGYALTTEGMALADRVSHNDMTVRKQPQIITAIRVTSDTGQTVLFKHSFQPYLNLVGFPQGRAHFNETVLQSAIRELAEKTGLTGIELTHRGIAYIYATKQDQDVSKLLVHIFTAEVSGAPTLTPEDISKGTSFWGDTKVLQQAACMPGFLRIQTLLDTHSHDLFFAEIDAAME